MSSKHKVQVFGWKATAKPEESDYVIGAVAVVLLPFSAHISDARARFLLEEGDCDFDVLMCAVGGKMHPISFEGPEWSKGRSGLTEWSEKYTSEYVTSNGKFVTEGMLVDYIQKVIFPTYGDDVETFGEKIVV
jgi:hypothetical protein